MKLLHAADLHIDSPLRGLSRYEGAPAEDLRLASRRAFANLVTLALAEQVDAVLLAGDIFDGDWPDFHTGLYFANQMSRLREADIEVFVVSGNHDAASSMSRSIPMPGNVTYLDTGAPQTLTRPELGLAVHGQGFAERKVMENLAKAYPAALPDLFNVGLLHTSIGSVEGHDTYAPCSVEELASKGYGYWALGHVHTRQIILEDPWIVFPGNLQGRHARETGPKGCTIVTVDDLKVTSVEHHDVDVARWRHLVVDVTGAVDEDEIVERVAACLDQIPAEMLHAVRVTVGGATRAHSRLHKDIPAFVHALRAIANERPGLWLEKALVETRAADTADPALAGVLADVRSVAAVYDHDQLSALIKDTRLLSGRFPHELRGGQGLGLDDPAWTSRIAAEALAYLETLLTEDR